MGDSVMGVWLQKDGLACRENFPESYSPLVDTNISLSFSSFLRSGKHLRSKFNIESFLECEGYLARRSKQETQLHL